MPLPQTPNPLTGWQAAGSLSNSSGYPGDPQIAVSQSHVVVTARAVIAVYDKTGVPVQNPISTKSFFSGLKLGDAFGIDKFYDTRTIFDPWRKRFWICALSYNEALKVAGDPTRRDFAAMAVSKTQNPLDGWHQYYWDAVSHWGKTNDPVYQPGDGADYPCLGVDKTCIYQTNMVKNSGVFRYWRLILFEADKLASKSDSAKGWEFWDMMNPDGSPCNMVQPAVHHTVSPYAFFLSSFGPTLLVWGLKHPLQASQKMTHSEVILPAFAGPPDAPQKGSAKKIKMNKLGNRPLKAVYRDGRLYCVMNDARDWFHDNDPTTSIRLIRMNVGEFPSIGTNPGAGFVSRTFGMNNPYEDAEDVRMYYGWPSVEVNKNGDMALSGSRRDQRPPLGTDRRWWYALKVIDDRQARGRLGADAVPGHQLALERNDEVSPTGTVVGILDRPPH